jgi:GMP synthase (glutamine-hydrolysing)
MDSKDNRILVLDFGSQYTQLIARRVRENEVYSEILPWDIGEDRIKECNPMGIILSGGPESVTESFTPRIPQICFDMEVPLLGICYGMQTLAEQCSGIVSESNAKDFILIGSTESAPIAAIQHNTKDIFALQFHPEVTHTSIGPAIFRNFLFEICGCNKDWRIVDLITRKVEEIREQVGSNNVLLGLSGGVDSSVTAMLLQKAIGKQLHCMFIDNGLLRKNEFNQVKEIFEEKFDLNLKVVDASDIFLRHLKGVTDPEQKRKIIGRTFIDVFDNESLDLNCEIDFLAQGTIYPDVIESSVSESKEARIIKSHHNVGGLPQEMRMELVEPLRNLFKDEVRKVGKELELPSELLNRHPFPGPGLGVRVLGELTQDRLDALREADAIFIEELIAADFYDKVSQAFCVYLPVKSVGVVGDERRYADVIGIRAVETVDFMTAHWADLPYSFLSKVSSRIVNEIESISRVVYDISNKPPATIEWE